MVESYDADEASVRQSCLADVATCEFYVGIVGLRFGFVLPGGPKSISELEFDAASENQLQRLLFLKNPSAIMAPATDSHTRERDPALIDAFRKRLNSGEKDIPRPAVLSTCADSKENLPCALLRPDSRSGGGEEQTPPGPAPEGETELERMRSRHLNRRCAALRDAPSFKDTAVFANRPKPLTARGAFAACAGDKPVLLLTRLRSLVGKCEQTEH